ncbi:MAG: hypothetical protein Q9194_005948 [Teloschistes cf. exilis]
MDLAPLLTLPPELLCQIFESADDFSVVAALARTNRRLDAIWRSNTISICKAVIPRAISHLPDADRLAEAEDEATTGHLLRQDDDDGGSSHTALFRAKRLLGNARCVSAARDIWVNACRFHGFPDGKNNCHMRTSLGENFEHVYYVIWTLGLMVPVVMAPRLRDQA